MTDLGCLSYSFFNRARKSFNHRTDAKMINENVPELLLFQEEYEEQY